jgi:hypothetical protein
MAMDKADFVREYFSQMESQVQFGDTKASLLVAGNAILLATTGGVVRIVSGCGADSFPIDCVKPSIKLTLATGAAVLLIISLACALWAARPSSKHQKPQGREFFLLSYVGNLTRPEFLEWYRPMSSDDLLSEALVAIHGKAKYAKEKFDWLRRAVYATLLSLLFLLAALMSAVA